MKQVLFVCAFALDASLAIAQSDRPTLPPPAEFDRPYQGPGKMSVYYMTALEINAICLGVDRLQSGFAPGIPSCSFPKKDGCEVYIRYGEPLDELAKQRARCNGWSGNDGSLR